MNPWISHCKQYQAKHNCSYKDAMRLSKRSYVKQNGAGIITDISKAAKIGVNEAFKAVPEGNKIMKVLNPVLDRGILDISRWEDKERPIDRMTQSEKNKYYASIKDKKQPKMVPVNVPYTKADRSVYDKQLSDADKSTEAWRKSMLSGKGKTRIRKKYY